MPRTVAAFYDTRPEAESARARLISDAKAKSPRIISKDTAGAVDGLKIAPADARAYREGLKCGAHLVVAEVPNGVSSKRIVDALKRCMSDDGIAKDRGWGDGEQGVQVKLPDAPEADGTEIAEGTAAAGSDMAAPTARSTWPPRSQEDPVRPSEVRAPGSDSAEDHQVHGPPEGAATGNSRFARAAARVRSFTRDMPAEERVSLQEELIEVENRPSGREVSDQELKEGGLFKERVFEIAAMREEPVVTKVAVVHEEIIVRKRVNERVETIRGTVRHTEVEVEDLGPSGETPRFFRSRDR